MATSTELDQQYQALRANRPSLTTLKSEQEAKLGLGDRQVNLDRINKSIYDTTRTLENVGKDVQSRSRQLGSPITEAVRRRLTTVQSEPLQQDIYKLTQSGAVEGDAINNLRKNIADYLGLAIQERGDEDSDFRRRIAEQIRREELATQQAEAEKDRQLQARLSARSQPRQIDPSALLKALGLGSELVVDTGVDPSRLSSATSRINTALDSARSQYTPGANTSYADQVFGTAKQFLSKYSR